MTEYKAEGPYFATGVWKVVQYVNDQRVSAIGLGYTEQWAQRIANALNQMEIEG